MRNISGVYKRHIGLLVVTHFSITPSHRTLWYRRVDQHPIKPKCLSSTLISWGVSKDFMASVALTTQRVHLWRVEAAVEAIATNPLQIRCKWRPERKRPKGRWCRWRKAYDEVRWAISLKVAWNVPLRPTFCEPRHDNFSFAKVLFNFINRQLNRLENFLKTSPKTTCKVSAKDDV